MISYRQRKTRGKTNLEKLCGFCANLLGPNDLDNIALLGGLKLIRILDITNSTILP